MEIYDMKTSGIQNPIGYAIEPVTVCWKVRKANGRQTEYAKIEISGTPDFQKILFMKEGKYCGRIRLGELKLKPRTAYYYRITVRDDTKDSAVSRPAFFETGKMDEPWKGKWIGLQMEDTFHPVFRCRFQADREVANARLYISGLGMYEAWLNQKRIGREVLTPYYSNYHFEIQYQTYDISSLVQRENVIEVFLGNGWYKGRFGLSGGHTDNFGDRFKMICEMHIEYADGTKDVVVSDESWEYRESYIESSDIYDGEIQNRDAHRKEYETWKKAVLTAAEGKLADRRSIPVIEKEDMPVKQVIQTPAGECVLDFGQNFAGYVSFFSRFPAGQKVTLDFGEILQEGNFYNANYRSAKSQFVYVSDGTEEWVQPHFTYFGFRYVRVTGWNGRVQAEDFMGKAVYSDMRQTGFMETGNKDINRLFLNALWGQKSNSVDFPTDCPQRDERLGWTGDAQVFASTASYNMDTEAFYDKFLHDLRMEQIRFDGIVPGVIPVLKEGSEIFSSVWGDIATILPFALYEHFGSRDILLKYYPMMRDWVDRIGREDQKRGQRYLWNFGSQLGDWLALDGRTEQSMEGGTDKYFIASCYWAESVRKTAAAAEILGYEEDRENYQQQYQKIRAAILDEYYTVNGRLAIDTQTAYIVALNYGIYRNKEIVVDGLKHRLYMDLYKITGGFVGAPVMCSVMAENGLEEEALRILLNDEFPGWIHCIRLGATTIWERWNSVLDDGTVSGTTMNSLNHYAYGSVVEYLYKYLAGLKAVEPGFKKIHYKPFITARLGYMDCTLDTVYGVYHTGWKINQDGTVTVKLDIPYDCSAVMELPYAPEDAPKEAAAGSYSYTYQPARDLSCIVNEHTLFREMRFIPHLLETVRPISGLLYRALYAGDEEYLAESLCSLRDKEYLGFHKDKVDKLQEAIFQIAKEQE